MGLRTTSGEVEFGPTAEGRIRHENVGRVDLREFGGDEDQEADCRAFPHRLHRDRARFDHTRTRDLRGPNSRTQLVWADSLRRISVLPVDAGGGSDPGLSRGGPPGFDTGSPRRLDSGRKLIKHTLASWGFR